MALALFCLVDVARADASAGALGWSSDRLYRGISQSEGRPAWWVDLTARNDRGWSAAAGASVIASPFAPLRMGDLTVSAAYGSQLDDDWGLQLGATHFVYPGSRRRHLYDHDDATLSVDWRGRFHAAVAVSPDTTGRPSMIQVATDWAVSVDVGWHERLAGRFALNAGFGHTRMRATGHGQSYGSLGVSTGLGPAQASVSYIASSGQSDRDGVAPLVGKRWTTSLAWGF